MLKKSGRGEGRRSESLWRQFNILYKKMIIFQKKKHLCLILCIYILTFLPLKSDSLKQGEVIITNIFLNGY